MAHRRYWSARLQKFWGVGKICHREPWGPGVGSGGVNGRGFCRSSGRDCKWFPEARITPMYQAQEVRAEAQGR